MKRLELPPAVPGAPLHAVFEIAATLEEVAEATEALRPLLPARLSADERNAIEIALVEALTNIVVHGYGTPSREAVTVSCNEGATALEIDVIDHGRPIPAGKLDAAGPGSFDLDALDALDLEALPESGLGLAIVKSAFDVVEYSSDRGANRLHLQKNMRPA